MTASKQTKDTSPCIHYNQMTCDEMSVQFLLLLGCEQGILSSVAVQQVPHMGYYRLWLLHYEVSGGVHNINIRSREPSFSSNLIIVIPTWTYCFHEKDEGTHCRKHYHLNANFLIFWCSLGYAQGMPSLWDQMSFSPSRWLILLIE
ncbi:hypothetical protein BDB01DRAFT_832459 [Pilobolus umbonatus]|nr:hypothetical protein BDB01DRAFT_832459 [Pilobolus umbonatus]